MLLVLFAFLRWQGWLVFTHRNSLLGVGGAIVGFLSGLVGSAGPLGAAVFHALDLPPLAYLATEASTALAIHAVKLAVYQHFLRFDSRFIGLATTLGMAMVAGTWAGRRLVARLSVTRFRSFVTLLLAAVGLWLILKT